MKRFLFFFAAMTFAMGSIAFAAEQDVQFLRDGKEIVLADEVIQKNGKWMLSKADMEKLIGSKGENPENYYFGLGDGDMPVVLAENSGTTIINGKLLHGTPEGINQWDVLEEDMFIQNRTWYVPCREVAQALGYGVTWKKEDGQEIVSLETERKMPEITLSVEYDRKNHKLICVIENHEPQTFTIGNLNNRIDRMIEYFGWGWERFSYVGDSKVGPEVYQGQRMVPLREGEADGVTVIERELFPEELPKGQYRLRIPISYRYYGEKMCSDALKERMEQGTMTEEDWDIYYSIRWGKPDFFFRENDLDRYNGQRETNYLLFGEFEVK